METQNEVTVAMAASSARGKSSLSHSSSFKSANSSSSFAPAPLFPISRKRSSPVIEELPGSPSSTISSNSHSHFATPRPNTMTKKGRQQLRLWEPPWDPKAAEEMDVALADLAHSNLYGSSFTEDPKLHRVLDIARRLSIAL